MSSISKSGIILSNELNETIVNIFDKNYYIEPDGSIWIRIFHHNNPTNAVFASTNTFDTNVYLDDDRWFNVSLCYLVSDSWELMVKQKTTSNATEVKYRWIQTVNPMEGSFDDTVAANVTKITTSGYSNNTNAGGIYKRNGTNTYLVINNNNSGNWFGAIGAWNTYQEGIPGYPSTTITTGYMDLYLRVADNSNISPASIGNIFIRSREFIEV